MPPVFAVTRQLAWVAGLLIGGPVLAQTVPQLAVHTAPVEQTLGQVSCQAAGKAQTSFKLEHAFVIASRAAGMARLVATAQPLTTLETKGVVMQVLGEWDQAPKDWEPGPELDKRVAQILIRSMQINLNLLAGAPLKPGATPAASLPESATAENIAGADTYHCEGSVNATTTYDVGPGKDGWETHLRTDFPEMSVPLTHGATARVKGSGKSGPNGVGASNFQLDTHALVLVY